MTSSKSTIFMFKPFTFLASRFEIWYVGHIRCFNVELRVGACEWEFHADELAQVRAHTRNDVINKNIDKFVN